METLQIIIIVAFSCLVAYMAISRAIRFKKKNKPTPNIVWKHTPTTYSKKSREEEIFNRLNVERIKRDINPFMADDNITDLAWRRTHEMRDEGKIGHASSHDELLELKINGSDGSADLIAYGYSNAKGVIGRLPYVDKNGKKRDGSGWIGSIKHKKAIINPRYDYCGIHSLYVPSPDGARFDRWIDVLMLVDEKTVGV